MEQLTKNQAVATSQEAVQNQNEPQLRDENAHNDKSVHGVLNPTYQAGLRRDAVQPDIEALLVWLTPDLRIKKSLLKCNWTIRKRLPRCKMRLKKRLLAFSRRLHARIRKTRYM